MPDKMRLECPDWAIDGLQQRFGERFDSEMRAALGNPPLDLRINPLKTTREAMLSALRQLGLKPEPMSMSPLAFALPNACHWRSLPC
jgi:16S rRNA (cytosine967-C5)-methyltransferase